MLRKMNRLKKAIRQIRLAILFAPLAFACKPTVGPVDPQTPYSECVAAQVADPAVQNVGERTGYSVYTLAAEMCEDTTLLQEYADGGTP